MTVRHYSIDTLFSSPTPQGPELERQEGLAMISSLQPSRPRQYPQQQASSPLNQQPTRHTSSDPLIQQSAYFPRTQMEALPPFNPAAASQGGVAPAQMILDAAKRHPVFFTDRLKKAPSGVGAGEGAWASPVARGYVFNDGPGRKEGGVKL